MGKQKKFLKYKHLWEELRLLGINGSWYRITYELKNKLGLKARLEPAGEYYKEKLPKGITYKKWVEERPAFFVSYNSGLQKELQTMYHGQEEQIIEKAIRAAEGKIDTFSKVTRDYGNPKQWNFNPMRRQFWPMNDHYSKTFQHEKMAGDIKLVWELNRFAFVYDYVRAYVLTGDLHWKNVFIRDTSEWLRANPYRKGPNWGNGQELAIRLMAMLYGLYVFGEQDGFSDEFFNKIVEFMYTHGEYLEANIDYAQKAVHNNHLIGEALGMYIIGSYFPWFKQSQRWRAKGKELLDSDCLKQFYSDGGYCQNSHTYQRLALHYYLWYVRINEANSENINSPIKGILSKSYHFLLANMNMTNGMLPNYGANDGALLNPWTSCDYTDFRPLLQTIGYCVNKEKTFVAGAWDEELLWFYCQGAISAEGSDLASKNSNEVSSFPISGIHMLRKSANDFVVFRCGSVIDRFGQADQLHVDLWWKGLNIAIDPGSYLYNDEIAFHNYFVSAFSHNTVTIDDVDQMLHYRRFKFLYWTKAALVEQSAHELVGEHYGYTRLNDPYVHQRKVISYDKDITVVIDEMNPIDRKKSDKPNAKPNEKPNVNLERSHEFRLHWLLNTYPYQELQQGDWKGLSIQTEHGEYGVFVKVLADNRQEIDEVLSSKIYFGDDNAAKGWHSRYYSYKEQAIDWDFVVKGNRANFITVFLPIEQINLLDVVAAKAKQ